MNKSDIAPSESPLVRRALACQTYTVSSLEEAVELATRFKNEGKYDWFRGQQHDWPLYSTAARKGTEPEDLASITDEQLLLLHWIRQTAGLSEIANDIDAVLAIAQHHGLPTSLLDFTTDPGIAGYFAASGKKSSKEKGFIYCLNTDDLRRFRLSLTRMILLLRFFRSPGNSSGPPSFPILITFQQLSSGGAPKGFDGIA